LHCRGIAPLRQPAETCEKPRRQTSERPTFLATRVGAAIYLSKPRSRDETSNRWVSNDGVGVGRRRGVVGADTAAAQPLLCRPPPAPPIAPGARDVAGVDGQMMAGTAQTLALPAFHCSHGMFQSPRPSVPGSADPTVLSTSTMSPRLVLS